MTNHTEQLTRNEIHALAEKEAVYIFTETEYGQPQNVDKKPWKIVRTHIETGDLKINPCPHPPSVEQHLSDDLLTPAIRDSLYGNPKPWIQNANDLVKEKAMMKYYELVAEKFKTIWENNHK